MRRLADSRRGFTLSELLVGLVVTSIVLTAVTAIFIGVQNAYQSETESKVMTEGGRGALLFLEKVVPLAGYGIDPRVAFDVTQTRAQDNQDVKTVVFNPPQPALTGPANTIVTDDLAFRFREPTFLRFGSLNAGQTLLTLSAPLGVELPANKLLMVGCAGGREFAAVRNTGPELATSTSITVLAAGAPFVANTNSCLQSGGGQTPFVFLVQEHRLKVVNLNGRPWLVSFRDLGASTTDLTNSPFDPIAPDVEVFQVALGMNRARPALGCCQAAPDSGGNFVFGDTIGEQFFNQPANVLSQPPDYRTSYDDATRYGGSPANIRSVHITLVVRSSRVSPTGRKTPTSDDIYNWDAPVPTNDGFLRSVVHTAINTPNLMSRTGFTPQLRTATDLRDLNSWGG